MKVAPFSGSSDFAKLISQRVEMLAQNECGRLFFGAEDGFEGVWIDQFGELIVASIFNPDLAAHSADCLAALEVLAPHSRILIRSRKVDVASKSAGFQYCFSKGFDFNDFLVAQEQGMQFEIRCNPEHDFGLYLDASNARAKVREISAGAHVLNLFSYTCAFGVAAALGRAASVTNIDPNRDYLAWGKANAALNKIDFRVLPDTAQEFLGKHLRRLERGTAMHFDAVIVDPPAFGVGRGAERLLRLLWPQIFSAILQMKPKHVLLMCNDKYFRTRKNFEEMVQKELGEVYGFETLPQSQKTRTRVHEARVDSFYIEPTVLLGQLS